MIPEVAEGCNTEKAGAASRTPKWREQSKDTHLKPKISRRTALRMVASIGLAALGLAACGEAKPTKTSPTPTPEGLGGSVTIVDTSATQEASKPPKATEIKTQTPTPEVDYEKIDIVDVSTWPEKYLSFWDGGWIFSKESVRQEFQTFMEKSRAAFFEKEGITDELAKLTEIRPELRSLWGMIYWKNNKDKSVGSQTFIPVTPTELEWMMVDPIFTTCDAFWPEVHAWNGEIITDQQEPYATYLAIHACNRDNFSSDVFDMPISGKDGSVVVPRAPFDRIIGDLAAMGYVGGEKSRVNLLLINLFDENGFYHLVAPAVSLDGNMIAPKGSPCPEEGGGDPVIFLTEDFKIDQFQDYHGKKYTAEELLELLGRNMIINFIARIPHHQSAYVLEPKSKDDIATRLQGVFPGEPNNWPWVQSPIPTSTPTPK
jgi:hypothetical protein